MTTIAFRDGVLAADSLVWDGDTCMGLTNKLHGMADGSVWSLCGLLQFASKCAVWAQLPLGDPPVWTAADETAMVLVTAAGQVRTWEGDGWVDCDAPYYTWGTGSQVARGAMAMGATAEQAVAIAADFDAYTGGPIKSFHLTPGIPPLTECEVDPEIANAWTGGQDFTAFEPDVPEDPRKAYRERMGL